MTGELGASEYQVNADIMLTDTLAVPLNLLFATAECRVINNETTLNGKSSLCAEDTPAQKSSKTSGADSILSKKDFKPFWNAQCAEITSFLWLPTETEWLDSAMNWSNSLSNRTVENSWFSASVHFPPQKNLQKTDSISFTSFPAECTDSVVIKSRLVKLYPKPHQKTEFHYWLEVSRFVFNWTIDFIRSCQNWTPSWMEIKKCATQQLPDWTKPCPFQIKGIAIKDAHAAFFKANGHPQFRSRKNPVQSCFIPSTAIKTGGIYPAVSGKGLRYAEPLPETLKDSRLIWKAGKFFIALPRQEQRVPYGENQARVVAIDPGVCTFAAFYAGDSCGLIGTGDFSQIQRLAHYLDPLISKMSKAGKQKKRGMR